MPQRIFSNLEVDHNKIHLLCKISSGYLQYVTGCGSVNSGANRKCREMWYMAPGGAPGGGAEGRTEVPADRSERHWALKAIKQMIYVGISELFSLI